MIIFIFGFYDLENKINNFIKKEKERDAIMENVATLKLSVTVTTVFQYVKEILHNTQSRC